MGGSAHTAVTDVSGSTLRPVRVFHRGSRLAAPENSLAAIDHAIGCGADWIEVDVRSTRDRTFVLFHDRSLWRMLGVRGTLPRHTWDEVSGHGLLHRGLPSRERVPLAMDGIDRITARTTALLDCRGRFDRPSFEAFVSVVARRCEPGRVIFGARSPALLSILASTVRPHHIGAFIAPWLLNAIFRPAWLLADVVFVHWRLCPASVVRRFRDAGKLVVLTEIGFRDISRRATSVRADGYFVTA